MGWIHLAKDTHMWWANVNISINLQIALRGKELLDYPRDYQLLKYVVFASMKFV